MQTNHVGMAEEAERSSETAVGQNRRFSAYPQASPTTNLRLKWPHSSRQ